MTNILAEAKHPDVAPSQVYRPKGGRRAFLLVLSAVLGVPSALGIWYFGTGHEVEDGSGRALLVAVCCAFVALCAYLVLSLVKSRVTLWPDRIECQGVLIARTLTRHEILGRRLLQHHNGPPELQLVPRNASMKKMRMALLYDFDAVFWEWIDSLPDLDERELRDGEREILANEDIGLTPDQRGEALARGKRLSTCLTVISIAIAAWGWIYPRPYNLVVFLLIVLPWVAILVTARSAGLFRIDKKRNDPHPDVAIPFMIPGFVLMLRVVIDINLLSWKGPLLFSIVLAGVLGFAAIKADRSLTVRRGTAVLLFILSMSYGYGAGMEANALLDNSAASIYQARITAKHVSSGKNTTYNLNLGPWGPKPDYDKVSVSRRFYDSVGVGDPVCIELHPGAMRLPWYNVHPCPGGIEPLPR